MLLVAAHQLCEFGERPGAVWRERQSMRAAVGRRRMAHQQPARLQPVEDGNEGRAVDPERAVQAIFAALERAGATVIEQRDPAVLPKARREPAPRPPR